MVEKQGIRRWTWICAWMLFEFSKSWDGFNKEIEKKKNLTRSLASGCWQKTHLSFLHYYPSASNLTHKILESQLGSRFVKSRDTFHLKFICFWVWKASLKNFDMWESPNYIWYERESLLGLANAALVWPPVNNAGSRVLSRVAFCRRDPQQNDLHSKEAVSKAPQ